MLNTKEISFIVLATIIFAFCINLLTSTQEFLYTLAIIFLVVIANIFVKKITAFVLDSEIEIKLWEMKRYWFRPHDKFKKSAPIGAIFPIIVTVLTFGKICWLASLVFEVKGKVYRAAKRWGLYTFSEITEWHIGLIAAWGIIANLVLALVGYFTGFTEFAKLNIYFAFFNMLPLSNLDGNKIFFGSIVLWSFLAIVILIALSYAIFLI